jgi:hypothetical protein
MNQEDKAFYENLSGKRLSEEEAHEARDNFVGFFGLLFEIDQRLKNKSNEQGYGSSNISDQT